MLLSAPVLVGQQAQHKPFDAQSASSIHYHREGDAEIIDIDNVSYEVAGHDIPGLPNDARLVLQKRVKTREVVGDIGIEATTTVEAWPLGVDPKEKPRFALITSGTDPRVLNDELIVISRGLEEVDWWSVYGLGNGEHLFDTYTPLVQFSISRDIQTLRYAGLEVPPDDTPDARLRAPSVVGVVTYASAQRVRREALITCDDVKLAALLRSYADSTRALSFSAGGLRLAISQNYPSPPKTTTIIVPVIRDDLDISHATLPVGLHVTAWKR
jgi:hypothetical protein